ncbi:MAG: hypothetical protein OEM82_13810 [Acidobacteriota bacterium]|nr:hypothetical protein [Acidobacteriota bacterium]MDH3530129.1 hypothetical protein [Acidobacteriota bacterium]
MKRTGSFSLLLIVALAAAVTVCPQERQIIPNVINQGEIDLLVEEFTRNEDEFRYALTQYVFTRKATIQTVGLGGLITGTYRRDSFMTFTDSGERFERILYAPISTLRDLQITREDLEDLGGVNPFAINPRDADQYHFQYIGKQKIDYLNLHVFDVRPKVVPDPKKSNKRYFRGRIWVDDRDKMIVKSEGKGIPEGKQRFPVVETWRINVDGKYWFPAYSTSDDELVFDNGQVVKIRLRVSYDDYKQGRSDVRVLDEDTEIIDEKEPKDNAPPPLEDN